MGAAQHIWSLPDVLRDGRALRRVLEQHILGRLRPGLPRAGGRAHQRASLRQGLPALPGLRRLLPGGVWPYDVESVHAVLGGCPGPGLLYRPGRWPYVYPLRHRPAVLLQHQDRPGHWDRRGRQLVGRHHLPYCAVQVDRRNRVPVGRSRDRLHLPRHSNPAGVAPAPARQASPSPRHV